MMILGQWLGGLWGGLFAFWVFFFLGGFFLSGEALCVCACGFHWFGSKHLALNTGFVQDKDTEINKNVLTQQLYKEAELKSSRGVNWQYLISLTWRKWNCWCGLLGESNVFGSLTRDCCVLCLPSATRLGETLHNGLD